MWGQRELSSYLGLHNYYGHFNANFSTLLQPLHGLFPKEVKWERTKECEQALQHRKSELMAGRVWVPYDKKRKLIRWLRPLTYLVRVGCQLCYTHIDYLMQMERVNSEGALDEVVPEEALVPVSVSSTSVSEPTLEQPAQSLNSRATQEPVS